MKVFSILLFASITTSSIGWAKENIPRPLRSQVVRAGDTLSIKPKLGQPIVYTNKNEDGEGFYSVEFKEHSKSNNVVVVQQNFYEGELFELVSLNTGQKLEIPSSPAWSNNQKYFASTVCGGELAPGNQYAIGKCDDESCRILASDPKPADGAKWVSASIVEVQLVQPGSCRVKSKPIAKMVCAVSDTLAECKPK